MSYTPPKLNYLICYENNMDTLKREMVMVLSNK